MRLVKPLSCLMGLCGMLGAMKGAQAQVTLTLMPSSLIGAPGTTVQFEGTLHNTGSDVVYLTGDLYDSLASGLSLDDSPFIFNAPTSLAANGDPSGLDTYTGPIFDLTVAPTTQELTYTYNFSVLGGTDPLAQNVVGISAFSVTVPEPSACALAAVLGLGSLSLLRQRKRRVCAE